jgi:hypothetical protein
MHDINMLNRSPLFAKLANRKAQEAESELNGYNYIRGTILHMGYIHRGNICEANSSLLKWSRISFHSAQAPASKDVERILGILQVQFNVNRGPTLG